jgi:hypothetical protein
VVLLPFLSGSIFSKSNLLPDRLRPCQYHTTNPSKCSLKFYPKREADICFIPQKTRRMGVPIRQTCDVTGERTGKPFYRRGGRLASFKSLVARVKLPGLSPCVLRFHIFDVEPPSVVIVTTENIIRQISGGYLKNNLHICNDFPTETLSRLAKVLYGFFPAHSPKPTQPAD